VRLSQARVVEWHSPGNGYPAALTADPTGGIWLAAYSGSATFPGIFNVATDGSATLRYHAALPQVRALMMDGMHSLWLISDQPVVERIDARGESRRFSNFSSASLIPDWATDTQGDLWFVEPDQKSIGELLRSGAGRHYRVGVSPDSIAVSGCCARFMYDHGIGSLRDGAVKLYAISSLSRGHGRWMASSESGDQWFLGDGGQVGHIAASGAIHMIALPMNRYASTWRGSTVRIVAGRKHDAWFLASAPWVIGHLRSNGQLNVYILPDDLGAVQGMALDGSGNVWLTAPGARKIARLTPR